MKTLARTAFVTFFLLAACVFCTSASAQLVERNPWCSEGPDFDADKNGTIDRFERGGCTFADQFVSISGIGRLRFANGTSRGWSVEVAGCILEGFIKSPEPSLPGGFSVVQHPERTFFTSQIWCKGTFPPGEYEIWALLRFPNPAEAGLNIGPKLYSFSERGVPFDQPVLFTTPAPEFTWIHLKNLIYDAEVSPPAIFQASSGLFIKSDSGQEFGCPFVRIPNGKAPEAGELDCPNVSTNAPISVVVTPQRFVATFVWTFQGGKILSGRLVYVTAMV